MEGEQQTHMKLSKTRRVLRCLGLVPWRVFVTVGVFAVGVAFWTGGSIKARDTTLQLADAIGVDGTASRWLYNTATTVIIAVTIGSCIIVGLALLLSLIRTVERGLLFGACGGGDGSPPEPWVFLGYRIVAIMLNAMVWALLVVCVALLVIMLVWWGGLAALKSGIDNGVSAADVILPSGASLSAASEITGLVTSALSSSGPSLAGLFGGAGLPFTPICAPVCLNAGSFAPLLRLGESCVCGAAAIDTLRAESGRGATAAAVGLAGAGAMWLGSCLLLVILASHAVTAKFDRKSAAFLKQQRAEEYYNGFAANLKDCVPMSHSDEGAHVRSSNGGFDGIHYQADAAGAMHHQRDQAFV